MNYVKTCFIPVSFLFFIACSSVEDERDTAFEEAQISREYTDDSLDMETEAELVPLLHTKPKKVDADPWTTFSTEIEKEIKANEKTIADLRLVSGTNVKLFKKIAALEKNNQEFHNRLLNFNHEKEATIEKFKADLKTDMIKLKDDLASLFESVPTD